MTSADPLNTVGAVLTRRFKETDDIVTVERGTWGLREWYSGRSRNKGQPKTNGDEAKASANAPEQPSKQSPSSVFD